MPRLSKEDAKDKQELNADADRLAAAGDIRGAENLRGIADTIKPSRTSQRG
jgi:hypothetical protein